jgi:hypothetical protein
MSVSPEKIAAIVIFSIPWMMAVYELYRGWTKGFMKEYPRSSYNKLDNFNENPDRFCYRKEQPHCTKIKHDFHEAGNRHLIEQGAEIFFQKLKLHPDMIMIGRV